ncbi:MAG: tRNA pseudouridine(55) synthase TruB [Anaerolineales bacterium]|nr:tRNA pseudouridine(55) synthase TruB [Anaerolineales bacterium]
MNALLILDKPQGLSSHSAIHRIRKITGIERVGHAGTLDPMATGVLLVLLGSAVRLAEYVVDHDKKYRATIQLGVETDTYDATGNIVQTARPESIEGSNVNVSAEEIRAVVASFVGKLNQIPPAHSAIQIKGKRAYKLARQGFVLEMEPRAVEIYSIALQELEPPRLALDVHCSKGMYIRSLAHAIGAKLGTGAHLAGLRRTASGDFPIEASHTLEQIVAAVETQTLSQLVLPMDLAVQHFDAVYLDAAQARAVRNGLFIPAPFNLTTPLVRAYDDKRDLIAILEPTAAQRLKPKKVLDTA